MELLLVYALFLLQEARACTSFFTVGDLGSHDASATASAIALSLDGAPYGFPHAGHGPCDQLAAVASDGSVRGVALNTTSGWNLGMLGTIGERIFFQYHESDTGALRVSSYVFYMADDASISTFSSPLTLPFSTSHDPCAFACSYYSVLGFVFPVPSDRNCYFDGALCRISGQSSVYQCYVDSEATTPCFVPFPPPLPRPPPRPPPPPLQPPPVRPSPAPSFPPAVPAGQPQMPPPPPSNPPPPESTPHPPTPPNPSPPPPPSTPPASSSTDGTNLGVVIFGASLATLFVLGVGVQWYMSSVRKPTAAVKPPIPTPASAVETSDSEELLQETPEKSDA